jgi:hypothetical protein
MRLTQICSANHFYGLRVARPGGTAMSRKAISKQQHGRLTFEQPLIPHATSKVVMGRNHPDLFVSSTAFHYI